MSAHWNGCGTISSEYLWLPPYKGICLWQLETRRPDPLPEDVTYRLELPAHYRGRAALACLLDEANLFSVGCKLITLGSTCGGSLIATIRFPDGHHEGRDIIISEEDKTTIWEDDGTPWPTRKADAFEHQVLTNLSLAVLYGEGKAHHPGTSVPCLFAMGPKAYDAVLAFLPGHLKAREGYHGSKVALWGYPLLQDAHLGTRNAVMVYNMPSAAVRCYDCTFERCS